MLLLWLTAAAATAAPRAPEPVDCPEQSATQAFHDAARAGEAAFSEMDLPTLTQAREQALAVVPCLEEPVELGLAADFHRLMALAAFTAGEQAQVLAEFHAARRLQPGYAVPEEVAPAGHPLTELYERSVDADEEALQPTIPPEGGWVAVDGVRGAPRPGGISNIVQVYGPDDAHVETRYLHAGEPTPAWGPLPEEKLQRQRRRRFLGATTGVGAVATGVFYGLSWKERRAFDNLDEPLGDNQLEAQRTRTNGLYWASVGTGIATAAFGTLLVVTW